MGVNDRQPASSLNPPRGASGAALAAGGAASAAAVRVKPPRDARDAATRALAQVVQFGGDGDLTPPETTGLAPRDAALAHAIYDAGVRRVSTIEFIASRFLVQPIIHLPAPARAALVAGGVQLLFLDRIPVHAAINETVEWVKRAGHPKLSGVVNAVLRKLARLAEVARPLPVYDFSRHQIPRSDGGAFSFPPDDRGEPLFPEDPALRLALATGTPERLITHWAQEFGPPVAKELALHRLVSPPVVINARHATGPLDESMFASASASGTSASRQWTGSHSELRAMLESRRDIWVQDAASSRAVEGARNVVGPLKGGVILDLCAGQGTKTRQLAACFPEASVFATDSDLRRVATLRQATSHLPKVRVVELGELASRLATAPAMVLLDVPCSNSGVLARRVEAALRWSETQTRRLAELQRELLAQGRSLLGPGGWLVYSTCSIDRAENQEQVAWAAGHLGLDVIAEEPTLPAGVPGEGVYRDGSFWTVMRVPPAGRRDHRGPAGGSDAHIPRADGVHSAHSPSRPGARGPRDGSMEPTAC